ncbi:MAG: DsbA family protein [Pseudomonadota bacterium]
MAEQSKLTETSREQMFMMALPALAGIVGFIVLMLFLATFPASLKIKTDASIAPQTRVAGSAATATDKNLVRIADATSVSEMSPSQKEQLGKFIREYLVANPEILMDVSRALEEKQRVAQSKAQTDTIVENAKSIYRDPLDYVYGNPKGDVAVVEYFDYNCAWCKRALNEVQQLVAADKNVRVIMKEYPIFGEHSEFAARAALASREQGKYWDFHVALMKQQRVTKDVVLSVAKDVGIDVEKMQEDMKADKISASLKKTQEIAGVLEIQGTPGFLVDTKVNVGYIPLQQIQALVADVRQTGGCKACN